MERTAEEIKTGIKCCHINDVDLCDCESCPYAHKGWQTAGCDITMAEDSLTLIQQLQAENAEKEQRIRQLEAERDAAVGAMPLWTSVEDDKKPRNGKEYLCICSLPDDPKHEWDWMSVLRWHSNGDNGYVKGPHFQHEGSEGMHVTHWMELPKQPKK